MSLGDREDELLGTLDAAIGADLPYVFVGGWAIATVTRVFRHLDEGSNPATPMA